ncbi:hypothetical protein [Pendulispora albinea]|uniref:Uncharacterized protein n=1 Tax=Pendulispora albinea TaxID=2741071 RepID=A0ABZ2MAP2_9BACT
MQIDVPSQPASSLKAFGLQYVMIVLGILTALGTEQVVLTLRHQSSGEAAQHEIEAELRANLEDIRSTVRSNIERHKPMYALRDELAREIQAGTPNATIQERIITPSKGSLTLRLSLATFRHEAWDVSVANQSVAYIAAPVLHQYAAVYADQRDYHGIIYANAHALVSSSRYTDVKTDVDIGNVVPQELLRVLNQHLFAVELTQGNLRGLEAKLAKVLSVPSEFDVGTTPAARAAAAR